ncbi:hypothetical protein Tco_0627778 [Tanacetum coccineum]|uniref:Uncharacterized protein n=1 Tax=Tanacetum coccineum TaxID=301880 RepID=A0ABQ4WNE4_9ASTR
MLIRGVSPLKFKSLETSVLKVSPWKGVVRFGRKEGKASTTICVDRIQESYRDVKTGGLSAEVTPGAKLCSRHVSCVEPQEMLG